MTLEEKRSILKSLSEIAPDDAAAEDEENLFPYFLPLRSYSKLADAKVFLITGGRGAGKSELFRVLTSEGGLEHILSDADKKRFTKLKNTVFLVGYQASDKGSKKFPGKTVFDKYAKMQDDEQITCLWAGLLCAILLNRFVGDEEFMCIVRAFFDEEQIDSLSHYSDMPEKWLGWMQSNLEKWEAFLDRCDDYFAGEDTQLFITYDELDRICSEYKNLFLYIRNLLSFWFSHNNRWQNLKAKIFLRSDLYNNKSLHFVDSSKMRAYHLELKWDSLSLYRLLVKRLANSNNDTAFTYLKSIPDLITDKNSMTLGYLPGDSEAAFKEFVRKIIGKYMGKDPKRGLSYSWVPNHIQDANGELSPRPFLKCFVFAATEMYEHSSDIDKLEGDRLISPSSLQGALAEVSKDRVKELVSEEYGWLEVLNQRIKGQTMLMERSEFLKYLSIDNWTKVEREALPGTTPEDLLDALEDLGIFSETGDERINAPEIYLHGFGLKRRGGIKRPKR